MLPRADERLLGHVLRDALVPHDGQHEAVDARLEATDECRRSVRVPSRETGQKGLIRERCRHHTRIYGSGAASGLVDGATNPSSRPGP